MGMDIYNSVTILGLDYPGMLDELPDWALMESDGGWDFYEEKTWEMPNGGTHVNPSCYNVNGTGRYDDTCAIEAWAVEFTKEHPEATVVYAQEWYENDAGQSSDVYRNGEKVLEESTVSGMVPVQLAEMLTEAKAALHAYEVSVDDVHADEISAEVHALAENLRVLIRGLS